MVKIFVGNLSQETTTEELRSLFSQYGKISECDIVKNYGFVHMDDKAEAEQAIRNLHHYELHGQPMNVEMSRGKTKASTKLHVSNIGSGCTNQELRAKFEEYGPVVECDIVKDYAFVHMERVEDAMEAISGLDNTAFQGKLMSVQLSTSRLRTAPGMGDQTGCYACGKPGHWSKDCHLSQNGGYSEIPGGGYGFMGGTHGGRGFLRGPPGFGRGGPGFPGGRGISMGPFEHFGRQAYGRPPGFMGGLPPPPMSHRVSYGPAGEYSGSGGSSYSERGPVYERYSSVDFYEKYRAQPYGAGSFENRRLSYPAPSSSIMSRERLSSSRDTYERRPPPPPAPGSSYYARDRSPIRRVSASAEGYSHERLRLSPATSLPKNSTYDASQARDPYAEQARYAY